METEGDEENQEGESDNVSNKKKQKGQKIELQGEFRKIKPCVFDGEQEEVVEAWIINMNNYFQWYEHDHNLKDHLDVYQQQGKATLWWEEVKTIR